MSRRMTGGYVFTGVCLFNFFFGGGGVPTFQLMGGVSTFQLMGEGVTAFQLMGDIPTFQPIGGGGPTLGRVSTPSHGRYPLPPAMVGTPPPPPTASTGYAVGGMPLAFTQEEFLGFFFKLLCSVVHLVSPRKSYTQHVKIWITHITGVLIVKKMMIEHIVVTKLICSKKLHLK